MYAQYSNKYAQSLGGGSNYYSLYSSTGHHQDTAHRMPTQPTHRMPTQPTHRMPTQPTPQIPTHHHNSYRQLPHNRFNSSDDYLKSLDRLQKQINHNNSLRNTLNSGEKQPMGTQQTQVTHFDDDYSFFQHPHPQQQPPEPTFSQYHSAPQQTMPPRKQYNNPFDLRLPSSNDQISFCGPQVVSSTSQKVSNQVSMLRQHLWQHHHAQMDSLFPGIMDGSGLVAMVHHHFGVSLSHDDAQRLIFIYGRLEGGNNVLTYVDYCHLFYGEGRSLQVGCEPGDLCRVGCEPGDLCQVVSALLHGLLQNIQHSF